MKSMKRQNDRILKEELPRSVGTQYAQSITDEILAQMYYEKWNGVLPQFYGDDTNTLVQIPNN